MRTLILRLSAVLVLVAAAAPALALGPVDVTAELPLYSKYVWRGIVVTDDPVLQPNFSADIMGFGVGLWANMDLTDYNGTETEVNEVDWTLNYGLPMPLLDLNFGLIYYDFPNTEADGTAEFYVSGSAHVLLSPTLEIYYDFKEIDGTYVNASVSHGVPLNPSLNLELGASLGLGDSDYNTGYFGADATGANNFRLSAGVPIHPAPMFTVTPSLAYSTLLGDAKDNVDAMDGEADAFYFGISAAFQF